MHGMCLTRGVANVVNLDLFIKNNEHYYDVFIYGIQREINISAEITTLIKATIQMKLLFYLRANMFNIIYVNDINLRTVKNLSILIDESVKSNIDFNLDKKLRVENDIAFKNNINLVIQKLLRSLDIKTSILMGTLSRGKTIAEIDSSSVNSKRVFNIEDKNITNIENILVDKLCYEVLTSPEDKYISDVQNITIDELCKKSENVYGLNLNLVKSLKVYDIEDKYVVDIDSIAIEKLCYEKIS